MPPVPLSPQQMGRVYRDHFARTIDDAAFLWVRRALAADHPDHRLEDVRELETRLENALALLAVVPAQSWDLCAEALPVADAGEMFVAAIVAFRGGNVDPIRQVVTAGLSNRDTFPGLVSALGWLPEGLAHPWIGRFLRSKDLGHKHLGIAACSVRRYDPKESLDEILQRPDCQGHPELYSRALRLVGEIKRTDLAGLVQASRRTDHPDVQFWSHWSAVLLGDHSAALALPPLVLHPNVHRRRAMQLCLRAVPAEVSTQVIRTLAADPSSLRWAIDATGVLGDPVCIPWLLKQMQVPALARLAGEAFTMITGIDLRQPGLTLEPAAVPPSNDDAEHDDTAMDEDEGLPFPQADAVAALWQRQGGSFEPTRRYLLGRLISPEHLQHVYTDGYQRQRAAAALEWALLQPERPLANHGTARQS